MSTEIKGQDRILSECWDNGALSNSETDLFAKLDMKKTAENDRSNHQGRAIVCVIFLAEYLSREILRWSFKFHENSQDQGRIKISTRADVEFGGTRFRTRFFFPLLSANSLRFCLSECYAFGKFCDVRQDFDVVRKRARARKSAEKQSSSGSRGRDLIWPLLDPFALLASPLRRSVLGYL